MSDVPEGRLSAERLAGMRAWLDDPLANPTGKATVRDLIAHIDAQAATIEDLTAERDHWRQQAVAVNFSKADVAALAAAFTEEPEGPQPTCPDCSSPIGVTEDDFGDPAFCKNPIHAPVAAEEPEGPPEPERPNTIGPDYDTTDVLVARELEEQHPSIPVLAANDPGEVPR